jgi:hypothetical protein
MRKVTVFAAVMMAVFVLPALAMPARGAVTYNLVIDTSTDGQLKARASGGAYCHAQFADASDDNYYKIYDGSDGQTWYGGAGFSWDYIKATLFTDLEAPGWADRAYRQMQVWKGSTLLQDWTESTDQNNWEFTQSTNTFAHGTSALWKFRATVVRVVEVSWRATMKWKQGR